jgi:hypothetical protein
VATAGNSSPRAASGGHEDAPGDGGHVGVHLGDACPLLRGRAAGFGGEFCGCGEQCLACAPLPVAPGVGFLVAEDVEAGLLQQGPVIGDLGRAAGGLW